MIVVIFEAVPATGAQGSYLAIAAELRPLLEQIDGFISIERFQSLSHPAKLLSLSFWRDEEAVKRWRNIELHREAQAKGRNHMFTDYRLCVAAVMRDYGLNEREQAPADSHRSTYAHTGA
ncbi:antibiotic biosynthesis monooxygenase [Chitinimonas prasina]|uniref:Antibiotic biosynthesis monooxygenase n=1 Tax=Chitinimonas prasina TaxID=1434937 RepID=A0ABQ5YEI1_9NEIS|nr:antibiotic biosynthesis monooxygenase [Chitinimonas prasina]GLR12289.1 antibiotic biosynthesis monooxygenase [Chitinimonas prasina]